MSERRRSALKETTLGRKAGYHFPVNFREAAIASMMKMPVERLYQLHDGIIGSRMRKASIPKKTREKRRTVKWKIIRVSDYSGQFSDGYNAKRWH